MKTASDFLSEANSAVEKMDLEFAIARHGHESVVFIDVRDGKEIDLTGTIKGAQRIPRGFIEFAADDSTDFHNKAVTKDKEILLVCGAGGMAALAGKTLKEMGYTTVFNVGGFQSWRDAGGPIEQATNRHTLLLVFYVRKKGYEMTRRFVADKKIKSWLRRLGFVGFMFFFAKGLAWIAVVYFGVKLFQR